VIATLETDYLVIGAGAMSLAFVDTILDETDADVIIVDRYDMPGGHWRVAYDFVRLHQPSDYYGVNSRPLGSGEVETHGYNAGYFELASLNEIRDYLEKVVSEKFLSSGRVRYFPNSNYLGDGQFTRIVSGERFDVQARRRIVDSTHMKVEVPAMVPPAYTVGDGVTVLTPGQLCRQNRGFDRYVVIGGGKTGIDTILWLQERGLPAEQITWVVPRDAWLFNREICQPGPDFCEISDRYATAFADSWLAASTMDDFYDRLQESEYLFRLFDDVVPTAFRSATVTRTELAALRKIQDVVRLGRVREVNTSGIELDEGVVEITGDVVYVNCTADGLARLEPTPAFQGRLITLQSVTQSQQVYGASFIGYIESRTDLDDDAKNALTQAVPHPYHSTDFIKDCMTELKNEYLWSQDADLVQWRQEARLAGVATRVGTPLPAAGPERDAALRETRSALEGLIAHGEVLLADVQARERVTPATTAAERGVKVDAGV
jgi:hypothetical protein